MQFADQLQQQVTRFGVEILQAQDVARVHSHDNYHCVDTADGSEYSARAVLVASGSRYRHLGVPGEQEYIGAGIHFCATCDGPFYKGKSVVVVGGGNSATEEGLFLLRFADQVTLLVRGDELTASQVLINKIMEHDEIEVKFNTEVEEFSGEGGKLQQVKLKNSRTDKSEVIDPAGVFVFIGQMPNTDFLKETGIETNQWGFIITGHDLVHDGRVLPGFDGRAPGMLETSLPGIFAAGDVRAGSTKQVASAAGEGATAALLIREYLKTV